MLASSAIGCVAYLAIIIAVFHTVGTNPDFDWRAFGIGVSNNRQIAFYGWVGVGAGAGFLACLSNKPARLSGLILFFTVLVLVCVSGGRAAFGAALVAIILAGIASRSRVRISYWLSALACLVASAALAYIVTPNTERFGSLIVFQRTTNTGQDLAEYSAHRTVFWAETVKQIEQRPLLGHGEGALKHRVEIAKGRYNHPHNSVLQFLYQWGIIGTGMLIILGWPAIRGAFAQLSRPDGPNAAAMAGALGISGAFAAMSLL